MRIKKEFEADCTRELMAWEGYCWQKINQEKKELSLDPFYPRNALLTEDIVTAIIEVHEENLRKEIRMYPLYHAKAQGLSDKTTFEEAKAILRPTFWDKLPFDQQFAIVQGMDQICQRYRDDEPEVAKPVVVTNPDVYLYC